MTHTASCLCGQVAIQVEGPLPGPDACHCTDCRKFSGHYFASTDVPRERLTVQGEEHVRWYASGQVRRGFCGTCGSSLFWEAEGRDWLGVAMGLFDGPTHTQLHVHVWVGDQGDYYRLEDGVPQFQPPQGLS